MRQTIRSGYDRAGRALLGRGHGAVTGTSGRPGADRILPRSEDPSGRVLFYVYTKGGEGVAGKLIREGLGKAWERDGQHRELLMAVEDGAERSGNRGLCYVI